MYDRQASALAGICSDYSASIVWSTAEPPASRQRASRRCDAIFGMTTHFRKARSKRVELQWIEAGSKESLSDIGLLVVRERGFCAELNEKEPMWGPYWLREWEVTVDQAHAFISYVRENRDIVDRLPNVLRQAGIKVWLDRDDILSGERWRDAATSLDQRCRHQKASCWQVPEHYNRRSWWRTLLHMFRYLGTRFHHQGSIRSRP